MRTPMSVRLSALVSACLLSAAALAVADPGKAVNVQPGDLVPALESLAKQYGVDVIYPSKQLEGMKTQGVVGTYEPRAALQQLVRGTALAVTERPGGYIVAPVSAPANGPSDPAASRAQKEGKTSSSSAFRLDRGGSRESEGSAEYGRLQLEEVIVTAARRAESLSQVGSAVSAISGDVLLESSANGLQDYIAFLPGVSLTSQGAAGYGVVAIRGIAPQGNGAATATYVDEIPVGASGATTRSAFFTADIDPEDLQRVEVLKGPQGTLYGASSMGGVIKYVTKDPNLTRTESTSSEDFNYVQHGSGGLKVRGSLSVPLIDGQLAIRASAYYRHDPGFIEDIGLQGRGVGRDNNLGGRITLLFAPNDAVSVKLSASVQNNRQVGLSVVDTNVEDFAPTYGAYQQLRYQREGLSENTRLYSSEIHYRSGHFDLLSATGFSQLYPTGYADDTQAFQTYGLGPVTADNPAQDVSNDYTKKLTQEFRLTSDRLGIAELMLGAFYQHEKDHFSFVDTLTLAPDVNFAHRNGDGTLSEYAGFLDVSLYFSPKLDLTLGYRYSRIQQHTAQGNGGELYNPDDPEAVATHSQSFSEGPSTYLVAARYHLNDDLLFYARAASGYRPGGGRVIPPGVTLDLARFYTSDKLWSYELGTKLEGLDNRLTVDADAFYIDWTNIQTQIPIPDTFYIINGNGGSARSRGLELQVAYVPVKGLTVGTNGAFTDAKFTSTVPGVATDGTSLTYVPRFNGAAYAHYLHPITNGWNASVQGDYHYEGYRVDTYRVPLPGYGVWNTRVGAQNDRWQVNFYIRNLTDKYGRAGSNGGGGGFLPYQFVIEQPRTFGVSFIERF
jgi:iron complex outermembrane recepter protein